MQNTKKAYKASHSKVYVGSLPGHFVGTCRIRNNYVEVVQDSSNVNLVGHHEFEHNLLRIVLLLKKQQYDWVVKNIVVGLVIDFHKETLDFAVEPLSFNDLNLDSLQLLFSPFKFIHLAQTKVSVLVGTLAHDLR